MHPDVKILFDNQKALHMTLDNSIELDDAEPIGLDSGILKVNPDCEFYFYIQTMAGKTITIAANRSTTISDMLMYIEAFEDPPSEMVYPYFLGKQLQRKHTLHDCGIVENSVVHLLPKGMAKYTRFT
jgi:hypothetical protein